MLSGGAAELLPARFIFNACLLQTIDGLKTGCLRRGERNECFALLCIKLAYNADRAETAVVQEFISPHDWLQLFFVDVNASDEPERKWKSPQRNQAFCLG